MIGVLGNQKGGVCKTTNTVHLGASLAQKGYKVLLIDFDPQSDLSYNLGMGDEDEYDILKFLDRDGDFVPTEVDNNLFVVKGSRDFNCFRYGVNSLRKVLNEDRNGITINEYFDFILIDCPPSKFIAPKMREKGIYTEIEIAMKACDFFMIPLKADVLSVKNANAILERINVFIDIQRLNTKFLGFFFGNILVTEKSYETYSNLFKEHSESLIFDSFIRQDTEVKNAVSLGKTIFQHKPKCRASLDYIKFTEEFLGKIKKINN